MSSWLVNGADKALRLVQVFVYDTYYGEFDSELDRCTFLFNALNENIFPQVRVYIRYLQTLNESDTLRAERVQMIALLHLCEWGILHHSGWSHPEHLLTYLRTAKKDLDKEVLEDIWQVLLDDLDDDSSHYFNLGDYEPEEPWELATEGQPGTMSCKLANVQGRLLEIFQSLQRLHGTQPGEQLPHPEASNF